jgi:hypothetical protein
MAEKWRQKNGGKEIFDEMRDSDRLQCKDHIAKILTADFANNADLEQEATERSGRSIWQKNGGRKIGNSDSHFTALGFQASGDNEWVTNRLESLFLRRHAYLRLDC